MAGVEEGRVGGGATLHGEVKRRRFGLEGDVDDAESFAQEGGEVGEDVLGAAGIGEFDVRAEGGEGRGDAPDVDVVEVEHTADIARGFGDSAGVEAGRCTLEEDGGGLPEEPDGAGKDERCDQEGRDGVERGGGAEGNGCGGEDDEDRAEGVGHRFEGGAADVQVVVAVAMEDAENKEVDGEAGNCSGEDRTGADVVGAVEPAKGLVDDKRGDPGEESDVEGDGEDLSAGIAEGAAGIGRARGDGRGGEGEAEPECIGEHVAGIGDESDGAEGEADHGLRGGEEEGEREPEQERPAAGVRGCHGSMVAPGRGGIGRDGSCAVAGQQTGR